MTFNLGRFIIIGERIILMGEGLSGRPRELPV